MLARVLTLRFDPASEAFDDGPLQEFLKAKEVHEVREHFFVRDGVPYLAVLVTYGLPHESLRLELRAERTLLSPMTQGLPFLGFRVFPGVVRLGGRKLARMRRQVRQREADYRNGLIDEETSLNPCEAWSAMWAILILWELARSCLGRP